MFEDRALHLLDEVLAIDRHDDDALPGSVVNLVRASRSILIRRRGRRSPVMNYYYGSD